MPFRAAFDCLWCATPHRVRGSDDLEGWAQLCPSCLGRAGDNGFLRMRLRTALDERAAAERSRAEERPAADRSTPTGEGSVPARSGPEDPSDADGSTTGLPAGTTAEARQPPPEQGPAGDASDREMIAYYAARAPEYDEWYLRRGRYDRGPLHTVAWQADLDAAGAWLDSLPLGGEIVELAAGTGWWSPLLAAKGRLSIYDAAEAPLELARSRLLAHGLRAHTHVRDAWEEPDRVVDALFAGFWLSHVPRARLPAFLALAHRWLRPGGTFAFIDSLPDRESGARDQVVRPESDVSVRRLSDGREFVIPKVFHEPAELEDALRRAGFAQAEVTTTARFFLIGHASA